MAADLARSPKGEGVFLSKPVHIVENEPNEGFRSEMKRLVIHLKVAVMRGFL